MNLGEKIKAARKSMKITQSELAGNEITRNMVSRIESGTVTPSLDTIRYLARALSLPVSYLLSDSDDLFFYEKQERIAEIHEAFKTGEYSYCIKKISTLSALDNELNYILAVSHFKVGRHALLHGELKTAENNFSLAQKYSDETIYDTKKIVTLSHMYSAIASNIQSPLLEFNESEYVDGLEAAYDYELYKCLIQDYSYAFKDECLRCYATGKSLIKERKYREAVAVLLEAVDLSFESNYNAFIVFGIYTDLELCYKQLYDFENAYRYASKRMSMLEGFKS